MGVADSEEGEGVVGGWVREKRLGRRRGERHVWSCREAPENLGRRGSGIGSAGEEEEDDEKGGWDGG